MTDCCARSKKQGTLSICQLNCMITNDKPGYGWGSVARSHTAEEVLSVDSCESTHPHLSVLLATLELQTWSSYLSQSITKPSSPSARVQHCSPTLDTAPTLYHGAVRSILLPCEFLWLLHWSSTRVSSQTHVSEQPENRNIYTIQIYPIYNNRSHNCNLETENQ